MSSGNVSEWMKRYPQLEPHREVVIKLLNATQEALLHYTDDIEKLHSSMRCCFQKMEASFRLSASQLAYQPSSIDEVLIQLVDRGLVMGLITNQAELGLVLAFDEISPEEGRPVVLESMVKDLTSDFKFLMNGARKRLIERCRLVPEILGMKPEDTFVDLSSRSSWSKTLFRCTIL